MTEPVEGVISFQGYRLAHFEYDCNPAFNFKDIGNGSFKFNFARISSQLENGQTQINLLTRAFYSGDEDFENAPLRIVVEIAGIFREANGAAWDSRWESNAIAILYPYVRAMVGSLTAQSGREPVLLPTINVAAMFAEKDDQNKESE